MNTSEAEQPPQPTTERKSETPYERLVQRVTGGNWKIVDRHGRRGLTEQDILGRLEAAGISPTTVTATNYSDAFRIATQHLGREEIHYSGERPGGIKRKRTAKKRRKKFLHSSRLYIP